mmetsp:Transcript_26124/g.46325  ORF Transcript_26124/g.46325 Transcript_26124/m.46325 type:complete len:229 (+) Transcript_26124:2152-2838(+)
MASCKASGTVTRAIVLATAMVKTKVNPLQRVWKSIFLGVAQCRGFILAEFTSIDSFICKGLRTVARFDRALGSIFQRHGFHSAYSSVDTVSFTAASRGLVFRILDIIVIVVIVVVVVVVVILNDVICKVVNNEFTLVPRSSLWTSTPFNGIFFAGAALHTKKVPIILRANDRLLVFAILASVEISFRVRCRSAITVVLRAYISVSRSLFGGHASPTMKADGIAALFGR